MEKQGGHKQLVQCFNTRGQPPCIPECGYVPGASSQETRSCMTVSRIERWGFVWFFLVFSSWPMKPMNEFLAENQEVEQTQTNVSGVDDNPQILVANAFKARAALKDPSRSDWQAFFCILRFQSSTFLPRPCSALWRVLIVGFFSGPLLYFERWRQLLLGWNWEDLWRAHEQETCLLTGNFAATQSYDAEIYWKLWSCDPDVCHSQVMASNETSVHW